MITVPENNSPDASSSTANDSWDLDLSYSHNPKSKSSDGNEGTKGTEFIPKKGQKMAARRLKKIEGLLVPSILYEFTLKW